MSKRTHSLNAYEVALTSGISDASLTFPVDTTVGLIVPLYLVIDPDDPTKREYIKVTSINGNDLDVGVLSNRGLSGTSGSLPLSHDAGARVRAIAVHQWLDDIFDDVEMLEAWDVSHVASPDPHPSADYLRLADADARYVNLSGGSMTGDLDMGLNFIYNVPDPTNPGDVVNKSYLDAAIPPGAVLHETVVFSLPGDLEVTNGVGRFLTQYAGTVVGVQATVGSASTGSQVAVRVNVGGGNQVVTVPAGSQDGVRATPNLAAPLGTLITVDVTGIGSGDPGSDLTVMVLIEAT